MDIDRRELGAGDRPVIAYGHWGRPVLAVPAESGTPWEWEQHGLVDALGWLIEAGRLKLYTLDSGIKTANLMNMRLGLPDTKYAKEEERRVFYDRLEQKLATIAGLEASSITTAVASPHEVAKYADAA